MSARVLTALGGGVAAGFALATCLMGSGCLSLAFAAASADEEATAQTVVVLCVNNAAKLSLPSADPIALLRVRGVLLWDATEGITAMNASSVTFRGREATVACTPLGLDRPASSVVFAY